MPNETTGRAGGRKREMSRERNKERRWELKEELKKRSELPRRRSMHGEEEARSLATVQECVCMLEY